MLIVREGDTGITEVEQLFDNTATVGSQFRWHVLEYRFDISPHTPISTRIGSVLLWKAEYLKVLSTSNINWHFTKANFHQLGEDSVPMSWIFAQKMNVEVDRVITQQSKAISV